MLEMAMMQIVQVSVCVVYVINSYSEEGVIIISRTIL